MFRAAEMRRTWVSSICFAALAVCCITTPVTLAQSQTAPTGASTTADASDKESGDADLRWVVGLLEEAGSLSIPDGEVVQMTALSGQKFDCTIPSESDSVTNVDSTAASADEAIVGEGDGTQTQPTETQVALLKSVRKHLKFMCLIRTIDYWTYRVCPFYHITQYHIEQGRRVSSFGLGQYEDKKDVMPGAGRVYTQHFSGGDSGRHASVRFVCDLGASAPSDSSIEDMYPPSEQEKQARQERERKRANKEKRRKRKNPKSKRSAARTGPSWISSVNEFPAEFLYEIEIATPLACSRSAHTGPAARARSLSIARLLNPLRGKCLHFNAGWWTYEVCYLRHVRQFHQDNQVVESDASGAQKTKAVTTASYDLGLYPEKSPDMVYIDANTKVHKREKVEESYASQRYPGGTVCDITGEKRSADVHFFCNQKGSDHKVVSVTEVASCQYVIHVETPLLCGHRSFAPKQPTVRSIVCEPVATPTAVSAA